MKVKKIWALGIMLILVLILFGGFVFSNKMLFGTDFTDTGYYGVKYYRDFILQNHALPLWDPHIHGGLPFIEAMHGAIFFPLAIPFRILFPPHRSFGLTEVLYVLLAGWFMYLLLRHYKLSSGASFIGSIAYMFNPIMISLVYAGHDGKMSVIALLPFLVWLLEIAMERRKLKYFVLFGMGYALTVFSAHPQMTYLASWLLGALFVFRLIRGIVKKMFSYGKGSVLLGLFVLAIVLGIGISTVQLYPPFYYLGHYSVRTAQTEEKGIQFSNSWRLNIEDFVATTFPDFAGLDLKNRQTYWGRNFFRLNSMYLGMLSVLLALAALFALKKPILTFLAGFSLFAITYSMGTQTPLFYLYYYLIPQVKKFRGPEMLFFTVAFAVAVGMAFAVDAAINFAANNKKERKTRGKKSGSKNPPLFRWLLWLGLGFTIALVLLSVIGKPLSIWWLKTAPNLQSVNIQAKLTALARNFPIFLKSSWIALLLMWAAIGVLLWRIKSSKLAKSAVIAVVALVLIADLWRIGKPFIVPEDANKYFPKPPVVDYLKEKWDNSRHFRTLCLPQTMRNTHLASFELDAVSFSELWGNQLRWYDEFTGRHEQPQNIQKHFDFWDILNIEYLVAPQQINAPNLTYIGAFGNWFLYRNPSAFPRVRSFHRWETTSHDAALQKMKSPDFIQNSISNYRNTLLVEGEPTINMPIADTSGIKFAIGKILNNNDDKFDVEINMPRDGLLFLSHNWYPAWHAKENGKNLQILRADYAFIAVPLKKGEHKIHFYYDSPRLNKSFAASGIFLLLSVILLIVGLISEKKK